MFFVSDMCCPPEHNVCFESVYFNQKTIRNQEEHSHPNLYAFALRAKKIQVYSKTNIYIILVKKVMRFSFLFR